MFALSAVVLTAGFVVGALISTNETSFSINKMEIRGRIAGGVIGLMAGAILLAIFWLAH